MKRKISILVIVLLVVGISHISAQSNDVTVQGKNLTEMLDWLKAFAQPNTSYLLEIKADENIPGDDLYFSGKEGITLTLRGSGANRTIKHTVTGCSMFYVRNGMTLVLDRNITLYGRYDNDEGLVQVNAGGKLVMQDGSVVRNGSQGVDVQGQFDLRGGTISNNQYDGVVLGGILTMSGGSITNNGGTGVDVRAGTFTMSGGSISGNKESGVKVSGVKVSGGNVRGSFTMNGGTISGNTTEHYGAGVYVFGNYSTTEGVYGYGSFSKTGGTIYGYSGTDNKSNAVKNDKGIVQNYRGHAVYVSSSAIKIKDTTAGPEDNMSYDASKATASGVWDN